MDNNYDIEPEILADDESLQQQVVFPVNNVVTPFQIEHNLLESNRKVFFRCNGINARRYNNNNNTDKKGLYLFLNQLCDSYPSIDKIVINHGTDIARDLLLYYIRKQQHNDKNNNNNAVFLNRTIILYRCHIFDKNNNSNRNLIHTLIKNCSYFSSWNIKHCTCENTIYVINALEQNIYIRSLDITNGFRNNNEREEENVIDAIKGIVVRNNNVSKLGLSNMRFVNANALHSLVDALNRSNNITVLSFHKICHGNKESFINMQSVLKQKTNIKKLMVDSTMLHLLTSYNFDASVFTNLLQNNINNNNSNNQKYNILDELHIDFYGMTDLESIQQILLFFQLLKDSCIQKLIIQIRDSGRGMTELYQEKLYLTLFVYTIPYMRQLFRFHIYCDFINMTKRLQKNFIKSVG